MQARSFPLLIAAIATIPLSGFVRADDAPNSNTAQTPTAAPPANATPPLVTPSRSTPVSASQTSAAPNAGFETDTGPAGFTGWSKPAWLGELSFGVKESYDDNIFRVSGNGLPIESSWVNVVSSDIGLNLVPLLGAAPGTFDKFALIYQIDRATYAQASTEDFTAHRFSTLLKGKSGNLSFSVDEVFLYNDGNRLSPTYALNQLSNGDANQNDKYRNSLAHAPERERRNQDQDRYVAFVQYDTKYLFLRPISYLNSINMNTYLFNTSLAPYKGYQDYADRYDVNVGADLGFKIAPSWAVTLGYRDGYQYQQQFAAAINSDQHYSSNHYQRLLFGLEGQLNWLTVKLDAGPDFRDFNPNTPISELHTTRFYGEADVTVNLPESQKVSFSYKDYVFVSSTGLVPYEEFRYSLTYHWNVTRQFGFDVGAKLVEHNYTLGNDLAGSAPSLRNDFDYEAIGAITYAITPHLVATLTYNYDKGWNGLDALPAKYAPAYRDFEEGVLSAGLQYQF